MDNKNHNNDGVGDDFNNLPSEDNLNKALENASNKSNSSDEKDTPMSDCSVIKDGFKQNFIKKQPPKFIWDKIEQRLESMGSSEASSEFSSIKAGFEENFKKVPRPELSWTDLEEEMDNPTQDKVADDYSLIKNGFEKQYSGLVMPLFTWDELANRLESGAGGFDSAENSSFVKNSFNKVYSEYINPSNWSQLNERLERDTIRGEIVYQFLRFRKNIMKVGVLALVLLLSKTCVYNNLTTTSSEITIFAENHDVKTDENKTLEENTETSSIVELKNIEAEKKPVLNPEENNKNRTVPVESSETTKKTDNGLIVDRSSSIVELKNIEAEKKPVLNPEEKNKNRTVAVESSETTKKTDNVLIIDRSSSIVEMISSKSDAHFMDFVPSPSTVLINNTSTLAFFESFSYYPLNLFATGKGAHINPVLFNDFAIINKSVPDNRMSDVKTLNRDFEPLSYLDILILRHVNNSDVPFGKTEEIKKVVLKDNYKSLRFELGLVGKLGTAVFLGEKVYKAFESKSLSSTKMKLSGGLGLMVNCFFNKNDAVVLIATPHSEIQQSFGNFTPDGNYLFTDIKLSYFEFSIGYQRSLLNFDNSGGNSSRVYACVDMGVGLLTNAEAKINNETFAYEKEFTNYNFNLGLSLGSAHQFNRFTIDYGLKCNLGLFNSINSSSNQTFTQPANLLNVGGYISVRYNLNSKFNISRKK